MIIRNIFRTGTKIEWDYVADFGRDQGTERGVVQGYEVLQYFVTQDDGSVDFIADPIYKVHTNEGETKVCYMANEKIRVIEGQ